MVTERTSMTVRPSDEGRAALERLRAQMGKSGNEVIDYVLQDYEKIARDLIQTKNQLRETEREINQLRTKVDGFVQAFHGLQQTVSSK